MKKLGSFLFNLSLFAFSVSVLAVIIIIVAKGIVGAFAR